MADISLSAAFEKVWIYMYNFCIYLVLLPKMTCVSGQYFMLVFTACKLECVDVCCRLNILHFNWC